MQDTAVFRLRRPAADASKQAAFMSELSAALQKSKLHASVDQLSLDPDRRNAIVGVQVPVCDRNCAELRDEIDALVSAVGAATGFMSP